MTLHDGSEGTVADLALGIARHDAEVLRALAYRLHDADLSLRGEDLPE